MKKIGIFGKLDPAKHKYIDYLKLAGISLKQLSSVSEIDSLLGAIILEPSNEILWASIEKELPTILEIPFAKTLQDEIEVLKKLESHKAGVLIPLISRHHPKLVRLRALIHRGMLGKLSSIHVTMNLKEDIIRDEPPYARISGKTIHQLLNVIDYLRWIHPTNLNNIMGRIIDDNKLVINAKIEDIVATVISCSCRKTSDPSGVDLIIEAVGFERILVWDGTEQSLILRRDGNELKHIYWGMSMDELIARRFLEFLDGVSEKDLSEIVKSYETVVNVLKSLIP